MLDWLGWVATAVFASSYLFREPRALRWVQAISACLWVGYGVLIHALPVIVANLMVAGVAVMSSFGSRMAAAPRPAPEPGA
jgi:threonine/homoserine/homoserine lactone efflux protein